MRIDSRFTAIARDPVLRLARVHQQSLDTLRCNRPAPPLDEGQCRIITNELRREIDRLRRGCPCRPCNIAAPVPFPRWLEAQTESARAARMFGDRPNAPARRPAPTALTPIGRLPLRSNINSAAPFGGVIDIRA